MRKRNDLAVGPVRSRSILLNGDRRPSFCHTVTSLWRYKAETGIEAPVWPGTSIKPHRFTSNLVFYSIILNVTPGSPTVAYLLSIAILSPVATYMGIERVGRRITLMCALLVSGLGSAVRAFMTEGTYSDLSPVKPSIIRNA